LGDNTLLKRHNAGYNSKDYYTVIFVFCEIYMEKNNTNRDGLSSAEIEEFKNILWEKRNEILGNVTSMEFETFRRDRGDLSNMPTHMADFGTDSYEIDNILGLMDSERKILIEIDEALDRIENGTYGICEINGEPIPKARLEAIPWARYCIKCAGLIEKGLFVDEDSFDMDEEFFDNPMSDYDDSY
jgi:RNA polymerase-binding protein DksA